MNAFLLADAGDNAGSMAAMLVGCFMIAIELALVVLIIAGVWKVFVKAGEPGWAAIIPIYNTIILLKICNKPIWWIVLLLIPCVSIVFAIIVFLELAKAFGKSPAYAVGMILLPFVFIPMLGFSDAQYVGTKTAF
jgi:hypothetical protein